MESKNCVVCGVIFHKNKKSAKRQWANAKYCSRTCSLTKTAVAKQGYRKPLGSIPWNKGITYDETLKARLNLSGLSIGHGMNKGKKFPQLSGENNVNWKGKKEKPCKFCGELMKLAPWQEKRQFCKSKCYSDWHKGENSPVYKGNDKSSYKKLRYRVMQFPEYVTWRETVYSRDNWTCQACGHRGSDLHAHHIVFLKHLFDDNNIESPVDARNCPAIWDVTNGKTLCEKCHRSLHGKQKPSTKKSI